VTQLQFELLGGARGDKNIKLADVIQEWSNKLPKSVVSDRVAATLHAALGASFYGLGLNDKAFAEYDRALARIGDRAAEMPRAVRVVRSGQARALTGIGKSKEAEPILRALLGEIQRGGSVGAYEKAVVQTALGAALLELRNFGEAKEHYELAIPALETSFGRYHYTSISAQLGVALALQGLGKTKAAGESFATVCALAMEHLGAEDPTTLSALNTYAVFLFKQGEIDEALEQFIILHEASARISGAAHPATVRYASNRALCHERKKRYPQAVAIYREIMAAREAAGAQTELADLIVHFNLGVALHMQKSRSKREEGLAVLEALIEDAARLLPSDNWRVAVFHQHKGMVLCKLGRYADCEEELGIARTVLEKKLGPKDGRTTSNYSAMARLYDSWGKPEQARIWRDKLAGGQ